MNNEEQIKLIMSLKALVVKQQASLMALKTHVINFTAKQSGVSQEAVIAAIEHLERKLESDIRRQFPL